MLNILDLMATLRLDSSEYERGLSDAEGGVSRLSGSIGSGLATAAKVGTAAIGAAATAVGALTKQAVDSYGAYEQLVGGVETLFGDSSQTVMENAKKAFSTAGMSANEYMDTVTSFSASLIQATGRGEQKDIEQLEQSLEAQYNASKRSLQDQYDATKEYWDEQIRLATDSNEKLMLRQAKDDALKELKRSNEDQLAAMKLHNKEMIAEAEAANSSSVTTAESLAKAASLADQAIIDMSDNANKMGTSMVSIQNAYQGFSKQNFTMLDNLKLGYGGTKEEMQRLLEDAKRLKAANGEMVDYSISSYADIVEAIHVIQTEMGITGTTAAEAGDTIQGSIGAVGAAWKNLVTGIADPDADLGKLIDDMISSGKTALKNLIPTINQALTGIARAIKEIAPIISQELPGLINDVLPPLLEAAATLVAALVANLPQIIAILIDEIPMIMQTIGSALVDSWPAISDALLGALDTTGGQILAAVLAIVTAVKGYGIVTGIMGIVSSLGSVGSAALGLAAKHLPALTAAAGEASTAFAGFSLSTAGLVAGIGVCVAEIINGTNQLIEANKTYETAHETHQREMDSALSNYAKLYQEKGKEVADEWAEMVYQLDTSNMSMEEAQQAIAERVESYWDGVPQNMWDGFRSGWDYYFGADGAGIFALMGDAFSNAIGGIKNMLGIHSPSTVFEEIGKALDDGAVKGILDNLSTVDDAMDDLSESLMPDEDMLGDDIVTTTTTTTDSSGDNLPELIPTGGSEPEREVVVILELDGIEVGRTLAPYVNRENARIGARLSAEGGF